MDTAEFLTELWGSSLPESSWLLIWTLRDRRSHWCQSISDAAETTDGQRSDTYFGVGLSGQDYGQTQRAKADQIRWLPGLWIDLDYAGAAHKADDLPPDEKSCWQLITECGLEPTLVVHSGYGLQPYWLFESAQPTADVNVRRDYELLSKRWQEHVQDIAGKQDWRVDSTHDLARVMRLPGTMNCKGPSPVSCRVVKSGGPRYTREHFEEFIGQELSLFNGNGKSAAKSANGDARGWDHWQKIFEGKKEGERNAAVASFAGKLLSSILDLENTESVRVALESVRAVNRGFKPPLDDVEVRRTFKSILKKEQGRRVAEEVEDFVQKPVDEQVDGKKKFDTGEWKLVIVESDPRQFRLYAPQFCNSEKGYLELTAAMMTQAGAIRTQALLQARCALPKRFLRAWDNPRGKDKASLYEALVANAETIEPQSEDRRQWVVAERLKQQLEMAIPYKEDLKLSRHMPNKLEDGSVVFMLTPVWEAMERTPDKIQRRELLTLLELLGAETWRGGENKNFRRKKLGPAALARLDKLIGGGAES